MDQKLEHGDALSGNGFVDAFTPALSTVDSCGFTMCYSDSYKCPQCTWCACFILWTVWDAVAVYTNVPKYSMSLMGQEYRTLASWVRIVNPTALPPSWHNVSRRRLHPEWYRCGWIQSSNFLHVPILGSLMWWLIGAYRDQSSGQPCQKCHANACGWDRCNTPAGYWLGVVCNW